MPIKNTFLALLLFFASGLFNSLHAQQSTFLLVRQADEKPVPYAKINGSLRATENGTFTWNRVAYPQITITAWNFADTTLFARDFMGVDTAAIYLRPKPEQLNEVLVNPKNSWLKQHIYGFERWQTPTALGWVFLLDKELFVVNEKLDLLYKTTLPKVGDKIPKQIYEDVLGNIYLLGKDNVQQIYITDTAMYVYPQRTIAQFDYLIKPLLAQTNNGFLFRETKEENHEIEYLMRETATYFTFNLTYPLLHNCGVLVKSKMDSSETIVYTSIDSLSYKAASAAFGGYVSAYIEFWRIFEKEGYFDNRGHGKARHTYRTQYALLKRVYVQRMDSIYCVFDPYARKLVFLDAHLKTFKKQSFDFTNCPREEYLYTDKATGKWWLQRRVRGLDQLESVRPGDSAESIILDPFVRNIRVHNNVVFYINERGQFRVKKID